MSNFQFADEGDAPKPPQPAPATPKEPGATGPAPPEAPVAFQFSGGEALPTPEPPKIETPKIEPPKLETPPVAPRTGAPATPTVPDPTTVPRVGVPVRPVAPATPPQKPIGPAPPTMGPQTPIGPAPPTVSAPPPVGPAPPQRTAPQSPTPQSPIPSPTQRPAPQAPATPAVAASAAPPAPPQVATGAPGAPATGAPPTPQIRPVSPTPRPAPSIALPPPTVTTEETSRTRENAPGDDFSYKIWSLGQTARNGLNLLTEPAIWLLRLAFVVGIAALAYILAGVFFGNAGNLKGNPNADSLVKNLNLASEALVFSLLALAVCSVLIAYEDNRLGFAIGGIGLLCYFVIPVGLKQMVGDSAATAIMAHNFQKYGYYLVIFGLVKGVGDTAAWLWNLPDQIKQKHASVGVSNQAEAKQRIIAREANFTSPCWKLPFCRESIRKQCPAFLARTTCWKFGRGCYCDEEMISRIVRGESIEMVQAPTRQSRQGKAPCGRCYIYLEHQTYKFRVFSPLALPATVVLTWLSWPIYTRLFNVANGAFQSIFASLSFNSSHLTPDSLKTSADTLKEVGAVNISPEEVAYVVQNMFGILLGFMLLIYVSKFIEWAIFKAKW